MWLIVYFSPYSEYEIEQFCGITTFCSRGLHLLLDSVMAQVPITDRVSELEDECQESLYEKFRK